jgi:4'-phosphopantetheinyl transferase
MGIAQKVLSEREFKFLRDLREPERWTVFYRLWTCKEALLKAEGTGFHQDPGSLCLFSEEISLNKIPHFIQMEGQSLQWMSHPAGYSLAWVSRSIDPPQVRWIQNSYFTE